MNRVALRPMPQITILDSPSGNRDLPEGIARKLSIFWTICRAGQCFYPCFEQPSENIMNLCLPQIQAVPLRSSDLWFRTENLLKRCIRITIIRYSEIRCSFGAMQPQIRIHRVFWSY